MSKIQWPNSAHYMAHPPGKLCVIMSYHVCPDMQLYPKFYALHRTIAAHLFNSLAGVHYVWFDPKCVTQNQRWEGRNKSRNGFSPQSLSLVGYVLGKAGGRFSTQEKTNREHLWSFLCSLSISRCHTTPTPLYPSFSVVPSLSPSRQRTIQVAL